MCFAGSRPNLERGPVRRLKNCIRDQEKLFLPSDLWPVARIVALLHPLIEGHSIVQSILVQ